MCVHGSKGVNEREGERGEKEGEEGREMRVIVGVN